MMRADVQRFERGYFSIAHAGAGSAVVTTVGVITIASFAMAVSRNSGEAKFENVS